MIIIYISSQIIELLSFVLIVSFIVMVLRILNPDLKNTKRH